MAQLDTRLWGLWTWSSGGEPPARPRCRDLYWRQLLLSDARDPVLATAFLVNLEATKECDHTHDLSELRAQHGAKLARVDRSGARQGRDVAARVVECLRPQTHAALRAALAWHDRLFYHTLYLLPPVRRAQHQRHIGALQRSLHRLEQQRAPCHTAEYPPAI